MRGKKSAYVDFPMALKMDKQGKMATKLKALNIEQSIWD